MTRKPWVGGNWKCNGTKASIAELCKALNAAPVDPKRADVVICPSPLHIAAARDTLKAEYAVATQNISKTAEGAFTGEVSCAMLLDFGIQWTLVGHSERRQFYGETDEVVAAKVERAQTTGMHAAVCIGELLEERQGGKTNDVLRRQIEAFLPKITKWDTIVIAYEPVWAIGTGVVATPQQAQETQAEVRRMIKERAGEDVAAKIRIVYGGSVNEKNCAELIKEPDIDGFLVGGASLKPAFVDIITAVQQAS